MAAPGVRGSRYEPLGWALLRAPLLPANAVQALQLRMGSESLLPKDPQVCLAIAVASRDLAAALERTRPTDRSATRIRKKLQRYLIRMSTRPTPFGIFAGVNMIGWSDTATDVAVSEGPLHTRSRPDMAWLLGLVAELEADLDIRGQLPLVAASAVAIYGDRAFLAGRPAGAEVSVRVTSAVRAVLTAARLPTPLESLVDIAGQAPGATPEKAARLVDQLWTQGFLRSSLRPSLTAGDPMSQVRRCIEGIDSARATAAALDALRAELARWDELGPSERANLLPSLFQRMNKLHPVRGLANPIQIDLALQLKGTGLHADVGREAAHAAQLLFQLSPFAAGWSQLDGYRDAFLAKYGHDRQVPLLEMLDPDIGLGPTSDHAWPTAASQAQSARGQMLLDLALQANRDRQLVVDLTDELIASLAVPRPIPERWPQSVEISLFVVASRPEALDDGEFQVVVGPNVGSPAAGRHLGRFADLLGTRARDALDEVAEIENRFSTAQLAEVVYIPERAHSANVAIRPAVRTHEIVFDTLPGVPERCAVPINELIVGVRSGRFVISWPRDGTEIVAVQGHMLNPRNAPTPARFLLDAATYGQTPLMAFSWGPATNFSFLPRVQRGRIVLALAQWRLNPTALLGPRATTPFSEALSAWRTEWKVPRHAYLAVGDNRLLLDLENPDHIDVLRDELTKVPTGDSVVVQEGLPGPQHAWLPGPGGSHICELVVPLTRHCHEKQEVRVDHSPKPGTATTATRLRPPGSDWLYIKLYCPTWRQDEVIAGPLRTFAEFATGARLSDGWFFVRYSDPECHLRIRFHGEPATLLGPLMEQVCGWVGQLIAAGVCSKVSFDTYEREVERYGGDGATEAAEAIFITDSMSVAQILHASGENSLSADELSLAIATTDDFLECLGLDPEARTAFYREVAAATRGGGDEYRKRTRELREVLGRGPDARLARLMNTRRNAFAPTIGLLESLRREGQVQKPRHELYRSYVHMHLNRILGTDHRREQLALELLRRTREGLERSPVTLQ